MQRPAYGAKSPLCRHEPEVTGSAIFRHVARHAFQFGLRTSLASTALLSSSVWTREEFRGLIIIFSLHNPFFPPPPRPPPAPSPPLPPAVPVVLASSVWVPTLHVTSGFEILSTQTTLLCSQHAHYRYR